MQNQKKVIIGMLMLLMGWLLFTLTFLTSLNFSLYLIFFSLLFISIGFWFTLSNIKEKISYSVMGLLDAISAPFFVYLSLVVLNCNYIQMSPFITSLIFGIIGTIIGIIGILGGLESLKLPKIKNTINFLLILQIASWFVSMMFAIFSPATAYYM